MADADLPTPFLPGTTLRRTHTIQVEFAPVNRDALPRHTAWDLTSTVETWARKEHNPEPLSVVCPYKGSASDRSVTLTYSDRTAARRLADRIGDDTRVTLAGEPMHARVVAAPPADAPAGALGALGALGGARSGAAQSGGGGSGGGADGAGAGERVDDGDVEGDSAEVASLRRAWVRHFFATRYDVEKDVFPHALGGGSEAQVHRAFESKPPGKRPDTLVLPSIPRLWLRATDTAGGDSSSSSGGCGGGDSGGSSSSSVSSSSSASGGSDSSAVTAETEACTVLRNAFSQFGEVRRIDVMDSVPGSDESGKQDTKKSKGKGGKGGMGGMGGIGSDTTVGDLLAAIGIPGLEAPSPRQGGGGGGKVKGGGGASSSSSSAPRQGGASLASCVYVQFTTYDGFCCAVRSLCGRVLTREGSRLVAPCNIFFDTSGYFSKEMEKKRRTGKNGRTRRSDGESEERA